MRKKILMGEEKRIEDIDGRRNSMSYQIRYLIIYIYIYIEREREIFLCEPFFRCELVNLILAIQIQNRRLRLLSLLILLTAHDFRKLP